MTQVAVLTGYGAARPVRTSLVIVAGAPWRSQEETTLSPLPTQIRLSHFQYARLLARRHRDQSRLVVLRMGDCPATSRAGGGITLATPGVGVATRLIHENVRETNIMYGIGGPLLQLVLFFPSRSTVCHSSRSAWFSCSSRHTTVRPPGSSNREQLVGVFNEHS